jgi:hypothetical protein
MPWNDRLTRLSRTLAELYPREDEARGMVDRAGLPAAYVHFESAALTNWHTIIREADKRALVDALIQAALDDFPNHSELVDLLQPATPSSHSHPNEARSNNARQQRERAVDDSTVRHAPSATPGDRSRIYGETRQVNNPWGAGSFYLVAFLLPVAFLGTVTLLLIRAGIPAAGAVGAAATLATAAAGSLVVIGALQLRGDREISDEGMLRLAKLGLETLRGHRDKGESVPANVRSERKTD